MGLTRELKETKITLLKSTAHACLLQGTAWKKQIENCQGSGQLARAAPVCTLATLGDCCSPSCSGPALHLGEGCLYQGEYVHLEETEPAWTQPCLGPGGVSLCQQTCSGPPLGGAKLAPG